MAIIIGICRQYVNQVHFEETQRAFSGRPVEQEKIDQILKAAQLAPTAVNYQPQMIYILKSEDAMRKINQLCRCIYGAPMVFLICSDEMKTWKSQTERGYRPYVPWHDVYRDIDEFCVEL